MSKKLISLLILALFIWLIWAYEGRKTALPAPEGFISTLSIVNPDDTLARKIVGIQPYMLLTDYLSGENFRQKLDIYLKSAEENGMLNKTTIVLLPEYIGTWLVIEDEKRSVAEKESLQSAMTLMVTSNIFNFLLQLPKTGGAKDMAAAAIFKMKAKKMANTYFETFSALAEKYQVYLVGGSIILPGATVSEGKLKVETSKPLENVSFLFGPDGNIIGDPIRKSFLIESEQPFLTASNPAELPVFDLPFAKTAILICADSWYEEAYQNAISQQVEVILVPSYCTGESTMDMLWGGYSGYPEPESVQKSDIGKITEKQAWEKYALPGKIKSTPAQVGMNVFLRGEFWNLGTDGQPFIIHQGKLLPLQEVGPAGIWELEY